MRRSSSPSTLDTGSTGVAVCRSLFPSTHGELGTGSNQWGISVGFITYLPPLISEPALLSPLKSLVAAGDGEVWGRRRRRSSFLSDHCCARDWRLKWRAESFPFQEIGPRTNTSVQPTNHVKLAHPCPAVCVS